jgi:hypothetical protein
MWVRRKAYRVVYDLKGNAPGPQTYPSVIVIGSREAVTEPCGRWRVLALPNAR